MSPFKRHLYPQCCYRPVVFMQFQILIKCAHLPCPVRIEKFWVSALYAHSQNLRKWSVSYVISFHTHGTTRLPLEELLWNLILEYFSKICRENSYLVKFWQELYMTICIHSWSYLAEFNRCRYQSITQQYLKRCLTFWRRNYFFNFSTSCI